MTKPNYDDLPDLPPYTRQALDRIIIGNQIAIMRALMTILPEPQKRALTLRVHSLKQEWRHRYREEVGFDSSLGDGDDLPGRK